MSNAQVRVQWVDVAKGIAIVLVVLYHSLLLMAQMGVESPILWRISQELQVLRMPLFFAAAGIFAGSVVSRSWRRLWSSRLSLLVWTFLLWTLLRFAYFTAVPMDERPQETRLLFLLASPIVPSSGLWFLHSLVAFFILAKLLDGRVAPRWQIAGATVLSMVAFSMPFLPFSWQGIGVYFVFFLFGMHGKPRLTEAMERPRVSVFLAAVAVVALLGTIMAAFGLDGFAPLEILIRFGAVIAGFAVAGWIAWVPLVSPAVQYLGRNTLQIYLAHVILIAAIGTLIVNVMPTVADHLGAGTPVVVATLAILISLAIHRLLVSVPVLRYAYEPPAWFSRSTTNADRAESAPVASPAPRSS